MAIVYRVYGKKTSDSGAEQVMKDNITEKSVVVDGLDQGTEYQFTVAARDGASESVNNPSVTAATATVPGKPVIAVVAKDGAFDYTITPPVNDGGAAIDYYTINYTETGNPSYAHKQVTDLTGTVTGPRNGHELTINVTAHNAAGNGVVSDNVTCTPATVPGKPTAAVEAGDASGNYTITAPTDNGGSAITGYVYRLKKTSDAAWSAQVDIGTDLTGTVSDLENGTEYSIEFAAVNAIGQSEWDDSLAVHFTPTAPVIAVTGVTLNKTTDSIAVGADDTLVATVAPATATDKTIDWSSSDETIATVDGTGKVTAIKAGTCNIVAKAHSDQSKSATCALTVTAAA